VNRRVKEWDGVRKQKLQALSKNTTKYNKAKMKGKKKVTLTNFNNCLVTQLALKLPPASASRIRE
jgi:hypothetical protein